MQFVLLAQIMSGCIRFFEFYKNNSVHIIFCFLCKQSTSIQVLEIDDFRQSIC